MKNFFVIVLSLLFSQIVWAQNFSIPVIPEKIEESEFVNYEQDFIRCVDWLENNLPSALQRKEVNSFVLWWISGTPDVSIVLSSDLANFNNAELLMLYIGGWAKYNINNPNATKAECSLVALESVIRYYIKYKDSLDKEKSVENFIKKKNKGTLKQYVEDIMKE